MKKSILDPGTVTHYEVDLHRALCGSGWLQATNMPELVTCVECKKRLLSRRLTPAASDPASPRAIRQPNCGDRDCQECNPPEPPGA